MNSDELIEFEGRQYINPDISRDEQTDFINTLRDIQAQNNAQIATETHNLGTDIDHPRGGLNGSEEYWKGLYQTPQTEAVVANMKAVAQQTALNNALTNYQNMLQDRYNQAYRNYQKRQYKYNTTPRYTTGYGEMPYEDGDGGDGLKINVNPKDTNGGTVSTTDWQNQVGKINTTPTGKNYYINSDGMQIYIDNLTRNDDLRIAAGMFPKSPKSGDTKTIGNIRYIYIDSGQGNPSWYRIGSAPTWNNP